MGFIIDIADRESLPPRFQGSVLVCEDNEILRRVIWKQLSKTGIAPAIAPNGKAGVMLAEKRMAEGTPFDLILMDLFMPEMDGWKACEMLASMGSVAPVVAMSSDGAEAEACLERGFSGFLEKPFRSMELWACLREYLSTADPVPALEERGSGAAPILDKTLGLALSGGDEALYAQFLSDFSLSGRAAFQSLREAVRDGEITLAHRLAHTFKGFAALIGAVRLKEAVGLVEGSLRQAQSGARPTLPEDLMPAAASALDAVLEALAREAADGTARDAEDSARADTAPRRGEPPGLDPASALRPDD